MIINILGGGPEELIPDLYDLDEKEGIWVGVDRGVYHLLSRNIIPNIAFGDFDSVSLEEYQIITSKISNVNKYKAEKDETDMELAINWALLQNPQKICLYGGTGGRYDHFMGNVQLLLKPILQGSKICIEMIDRQNIINVHRPGSYTLEKIDGFPYISFLPIADKVLNLTLEGFKYPLKDCHIPLGSTLCISNELNNTYGTFSFTKGILMMIRSRDLK